MSRRFAFGWLVAAIVSFSGQAQASPHSRTEPFHVAFERVLADAGVPGGAYAIVQDGRIVASGGYGVRRLGGDAPVGADTVFRIASVSKTFAAQLGAMLVADGTLKWDDPVTAFAPAFRLRRPGQAERLRVQDLLGQSTGLVPNAYDNLLEADVPLERILPQFATLEPICPIGGCYTYQNILFSLVEPAYRHATGQTYDELLRERLFGPLGLTRTSVGLDAWNTAVDRAEPHVRKAGVWQPVPVAPGYYRVAPAAGVNASAHDMARWLLAQMGSSPDVVEPGHVEALTRKRMATPRELRKRGWKDLLTEAHYGLGWRIYTLGEEDIVTHSGWVQGFVADIGYSPRHRSGLVVLLNGESSVINELSTLFWSRTLGVRPRADAAIIATEH